LGGQWNPVTFGEIRRRTEEGAWILDQVIGFEDRQSEEPGYPLAVEKLREAKEKGWVEHREVPLQTPEEIARAYDAVIEGLEARHS